MSKYVYRCAADGIKFMVEKPILLGDRPEICPQCGSDGERLYQPTPALFGFRLTENSHIIGNNPNEWERDV